MPIPIPETPEHKKIKELLASKLKEWLGASVQEYPSSGHELDVFGVSINGVSVYFEVIWSHSRAHVLSDFLMLQQSDATVKFAIASRKVLENEEYKREYSKVVVSQRRLGFLVYGEMLDGQRILEDPSFVDRDLRQSIMQLADKGKGRPSIIVQRTGTDVSHEQTTPDKITEELLSNL